MDSGTLMLLECCAVLAAVLATLVLPRRIGGVRAGRRHRATLDAIRAIARAKRDGGTPLPEVTLHGDDDRGYATIDLRGIEDGPGDVRLWIPLGEGRAGRAGRRMWLLRDGAPPREPTEAECLAVLRHFLGCVEFGAAVEARARRAEGFLNRRT